MKKKLSLCACAVFFLGGFAAQAEEYDVNKVLAVERERREALAVERYRNSERTDTFSVSLSSAYLFGMRSMADGGNGESLSLTGLIHVKPSDSQKFRFLIGGELFGFSCAEHAHAKDTKIQSINLVLTGGFSYDFTRKFSVSCLLGYGLLGGARMREEYARGGSETDGTMSTLMSFRTSGEYFINRDLSVFLGYRYFYLAPSVLTSAVGWDEIETAAHGVELGIKYRF